MHRTIIAGPLCEERDQAVVTAPIIRLLGDGRMELAAVVTAVITIFIRLLGDNSQR